MQRLVLYAAAQTERGNEDAPAPARTLSDGAGGRESARERGRKSGSARGI